MPNPNDVPPALPTDFNIDEIASLIGAIAAMAPYARESMAGWPQEYQDAVIKALDMTTVSTSEESDLTHLWIGPFRIVFDLEGTHHD